MATADYVELCAHSWFSFGAGASSISELVETAAAYEYPALGLTDVSNCCGSFEFAAACRSSGIQPIAGVELVVREADASGMVTFIAETGTGYSNLCRLVSLAYITGGRTTPELDARFLEAHVDGVIALLGAPDSLLTDGCTTAPTSRTAGRSATAASPWITSKPTRSGATCSGVLLRAATTSVT